MSATAAVSIVTTSAKTLDVPLPGEFVAAVDRANRLVAAAENLSGGPQQLHLAVLDALDSDRDLHADKAVTHALRDLQLSTAGVGQAARQRAEHDIATALVEHSDTILSAWCETLQPHLDALSAAAAELPEDLHDTATISAKGAAAMRHWANGQEALRLTTAAHQGAMSLCTAARISVTRDRKPLLYTDADIDAFNEIIRATGANVTVWSAARAGLPLHFIGSIGELIERLASYDQQRQAAIDVDPQRQAHPRKAHAS